MKKFIIILSSIIIVIGAVCFGVFFYNTHPSDEYQADTFSFKVPNGFKRVDDKENNYKFTFKCFDEDIDIESFSQNCTLEVTKDFLPSEKYSRKFENLDASGCKGYFCTAKKKGGDEKDVFLYCVVGTDTQFLSLECSCSSLKAKILKPAIKNIAESAKYTSDFRLADKPDVYDCEWFSVNTGSKYACEDVTYELKNDNILWIRERYAEATDMDKVSFPNVSLKVSDDGSSPAELADNAYSKKEENKDKYAVLTRDQKDMFGFKCEHTYYEIDYEHEDGDLLCLDNYYFANGKYTYSVNAIFKKNADAADIKEMLDGITIK